MKKHSIQYLFQLILPFSCNGTHDLKTYSSFNVAIPWHYMCHKSVLSIMLNLAYRSDLRVIVFPEAPPAQLCLLFGIIQEGFMWLSFYSNIDSAFRARHWETQGHSAFRSFMEKLLIWWEHDSSVTWKDKICVALYRWTTTPSFCLLKPRLL